MTPCAVPGAWLRLAKIWVQEGGNRRFRPFKEALDGEQAEGPEAGEGEVHGRPIPAQRPPGRGPSLRGDPAILPDEPPCRLVPERTSGDAPSHRGRQAPRQARPEGTPSVAGSGAAAPHRGTGGDAGAPARTGAPGRHGPDRVLR